MITYTLIRSKRKTTALYVRDDGVEVRAPLHMPKRDIDRFVMSKEEWIIEKLAILSERAESREGFSLDYGSFLPYKGVQYPIVPGDNGAGFDGKCFFMPPGLSEEQIKLVCVKIYRMLAKGFIPTRATMLSEKMSVSFTSVGITGAMKQWGSCTAKKRLNFSWRLIAADDDLIDYVIIHELAHITELNHSARFWDIVEREMPNYRECRDRLHEVHQTLLALFSSTRTT